MIVASPIRTWTSSTVYEYAAKACSTARIRTRCRSEHLQLERSLPPDTVVAGRVLIGFPYPPLSLLLGLPGLLLACALRRCRGADRHRGADRLCASGRVAPLSATLLLSSPRTLFVIEQAWTNR